MEINPHFSPYPGLRPFTELEALYFKGREAHILKIQEELLQKRFLMVTGASGDGKSSLIYAGLIPNIKAGFVRGAFGKWKVAVMRPGHAPLRNLASALVNVFDQSHEDIKQDIRFGYAALVKKYRQSALWVNQDTDAFKALEEKERKKQLRGGSNILLVVDQFEEFFTLDSNFNKETAVPAIESQLVMNLLLETARLAQKENIPFYIVCTMRSDFIGNAPAYRGLPEMIGNNQFFVPRLVREELVRVISEPAQLNGNKVNPRLVQRLINDLDIINTDVLPSLQHALRQIWEVAGKGMEELDLIHYCKVGGMSPNELPDNLQLEYQQWLKDLPEFYRNLLQDLKRFTFSNILNLHAELLFGNAAKNAGLEDEKAKQGLKKLFQCLTQIDDNRAVRNRMLLGEIREICDLDNTEMNRLILPFREQGVTLLFPFLIDQENLNLPDDTLMDITHEALIRNWKRLLDWTKEEYQRVIDYRELNTAMLRWRNGSKNKDFLFSTGNYEYFLRKFPQGVPPQTWMKRYVQQQLYVTDGRAERSIQSEGEIKTVVDVKIDRIDIIDFLEHSKRSIDKKKRNRKLGFVILSALLGIAIISFFWAMHLKGKISLTAHANSLATKAYAMIDQDPTMAFRLAEASYGLDQTELNKQVMMAAYGKYPFYMKLGGHSEPVNHVGFSHNQEMVFTADDDGLIKIWDIQGREKLTLRGHSGRFMYQLDNVSFSPKDNYVLSGTEDKTARVWDMKGRCIHTFNAHKAVTAIAMNDMEELIGFTSLDSTINVYDINGKKIVKRRLKEPMIGVAFQSRQSRLLAFSLTAVYQMDYSGNLTDSLVLSIEPGKRSGGFYMQKLSDSLWMRNSPDGGLIYFDQDLKIKRKINPLQNERLLNAYAGKKFPVAVATTNLNNLVLLDAKGELQWSIRSPGGVIWNIEINENTGEIYTCSDEGVIHVYDLKGHELNQLKGHTSQIYAFCFNANYSKLISCGNDFVGRLWDLTPERATLFNGHFDKVIDLSVSNDGKYVASSGFDYQTILWDFKGNKIKSYRHDYYGVFNAKFSPDNSYLVSTTWLGSVYLAKVAKDTISPMILNAHKEPITSDVVFTSDGDFFSTFSVDGLVVVWNRKGEKVLEIKEAYLPRIFADNSMAMLHQDSTMSLYKYTKGKGFTKAFTSSKMKFEPGNYDYHVETGNWVFASSDSNYYVGHFRNNGFEIKYSEKQATEASHVVWMKDGKTFFMLLKNNGFVKINPELNTTVKFTGHSDLILFMEISPDETKICSASNDQTVRLWDMNGKELYVYSGNNSCVNKVKFTRDGQNIIFGLDNGKIKLLPASISEVMQNVNTRKYRGMVYSLTESDKENFGVYYKK